MCRARFSADLGRRAVVLGLHSQWQRRWLHPSLVDRPCRVAFGMHEFPIWISDALRLARCADRLKSLATRLTLL